MLVNMPFKRELSWHDLEWIGGIQGGCKVGSDTEVEAGDLAQKEVDQARRSIVMAGASVHVAREYWREWRRQRAAQALQQDGPGQPPPVRVPAGRTDPEEESFMHWQQWLVGPWRPTACVAAAPGQAFRFGSVTLAFTRERPLHEHADELSGHV